MMDNAYYILAKSDNLMYGSGYIMDETGKITGSFGSDKKADFIAIAVLKDELLAADFLSFSINKFNKYGSVTGVFTSPEYELIVNPLKKSQKMYRRLEQLFKRTFWSLFVVGFSIAIWLERKHKQELLAGSAEEIVMTTSCYFPPEPTDRRIQWIEYRFLFKNFSKWFVWFWGPALLLVLPALLSVEEESITHASIFLVFHGLVLLQLLNDTRLTKKRLGALFPWVLIERGAKKPVIVNEKDALTFTLFGRVILMVGEDDMLIRSGRAGRLFSGTLANEYIEQLIDRATAITMYERWLWLLKNKFAVVVWEFLLALVYCVAVVVLH
jgi:hypothetical protein